MAEQSDDKTVKSGKGITGLLVRILTGIVLLALGFGGGYFYFANPLSPTQSALSLIAPAPPTADDDSAESEEEGPKRIPRAMPDTAVFETTYYQMEDTLTTNLAGSGSFLQIGVGMSTQYDAQVIENVKTHLVALRSDILGVMGNFTQDDVSGSDGRAALALAIQNAVNARLEALEGFGGIENVFFTSFVLQ